MLVLLNAMRRGAYRFLCRESQGLCIEDCLERKVLVVICVQIEAALGLHLVHCFLALLTDQKTPGRAATLATLRSGTSTESF